MKLFSKLFGKGKYPIKLNTSVEQQGENPISVIGNVEDSYINESPLINAIFQKVEKLIISGFLFVSFFASNIVTIICIL